MKPFVNPIDMTIPVAPPCSIGAQPLLDVDKSALLLDNVLSHMEIDTILTRLKDADWQPVSTTGMSGNYEPGDPIGSWRASSFQEVFTTDLFRRILSFIPAIKECGRTTNTDWDGTREWKAVAVNPLLRFIRYTEGGLLIPHYDAPYIADDNTRTLMSFVIYLDNLDGDTNGGETRFLHDPQAGMLVENRYLYDEKEPATDDRVKRCVSPAAGQALLFDHRILHESHLLTGPGVKTIIRTDVVYERVRD